MWLLSSTLLSSVTALSPEMHGFLFQPYTFCGFFFNYPPSSPSKRMYEWSHMRFIFLVSVWRGLSTPSWRWWRLSFASFTITKRKKMFGIYTPQLPRLLWISDQCPICNTSRCRRGYEPYEEHIISFSPINTYISPISYNFYCIPNFQYFIIKFDGIVVSSNTGITAVLSFVQGRVGPEVPDHDNVPKLKHVVTAKTLTVVDDIFPILQSYIDSEAGMKLDLHSEPFTHKSVEGPFIRSDLGNLEFWNNFCKWTSRYDQIWFFFFQFVSEQNIMVYYHKSSFILHSQDIQRMDALKKIIVLNPHEQPRVAIDTTLRHRFICWTVEFICLNFASLLSWNR